MCFVFTYRIVGLTLVNTANLFRGLTILILEIELNLVATHTTRIKHAEFRSWSLHDLVLVSDSTRCRLEIHGLMMCNYVQRILFWSVPKVKRHIHVFHSKREMRRDTRRSKRISMSFRSKMWLLSSSSKGTLIVLALSTDHRKTSIILWCTKPSTTVLCLCCLLSCRTCEHPLISCGPPMLGSCSTQAVDFFPPSSQVSSSCVPRSFSQEWFQCAEYGNIQ